MRRGTKVGTKFEEPVWGMGYLQRRQRPIMARLIKSIHAEAGWKTEWPTERRIPIDEWLGLLKEIRSHVIPWQPPLPERDDDIREVPIAGVKICPDI